MHYKIKEIIGSVLIPLGVTIAMSSTASPSVSAGLDYEWVAIATDGHGNWAGVVHQLQATAADGALRACPGGNCKVIQMAKGRCAAWAESKSNPALWGAAIGNEINVTESAAEASCSNRAPQTCVELGHVCDK
jgi:hypothetical protein